MSLDAESEANLQALRESLKPRPMDLIPYGKDHPRFDETHVEYCRKRIEIEGPASILERIAIYEGHIASLEKFLRNERLIKIGAVTPVNHQNLEDLRYNTSILQGLLSEVEK